MQRLAHVNVAKARNVALIHQEGLEIRGAAGRPRGEVASMQRIAQRLGAHRGEERMRVQRGCLDQQHEAEATGIVIGQDRSAIRVEDDMIVFRGWGYLMAEDARTAGIPVHCAGHNGEPSAHAEMHDEVFIALQIRNQVFRPAAKRLDTASGQAFNEPVGERETQIRSPLLDLHKPPSHHFRLQAAAYGFNFG